MSNRLRVFRAERSWTQAEVAERVGVSRQAIHAIEAGRSDPSLGLALKLAWLFDCMVEQLFEPEASFFDEVSREPEGREVGSGGP